MRTLAKLIVLFLLTLPIGAQDLIHLSGAGVDPKLDSLKFSTTQKWSPKYLRRIQQNPSFLPKGWKRSFSIPKAPANSSPRTLAELAYLHSLIPQRPAHQSSIKAEIEIDNFRFGDHTFNSLTTDPKLKHTAQLITATYEDLAIVVFTFKQKHNRIRPSILDKELDHFIAIPAHPAYPSGHALEAYTIAYLLSELDPENAEHYLKDAQSIAHNREIAGLHYPSDSAAGRALARQLTDALLSNPLFQRLLNEAQEEW